MPMAPQQAPQQGQPPQQAPEGGAQAGFGKLVSDVFNGISDIAQVVESADAPPAAKQLVGQIMKNFDDLINVLGGGGEDEGEELSPKPEGPADAMGGAAGVPVAQ